MSPHLDAASPWTAGRQAVLKSYLRAEGPGRPAEYLRVEEVPGDTDLRAAVTFYDGDEVLGDPADVRLVISPCWVDGVYEASVEALQVPPRATSARVVVSVTMPGEGLEFAPAEITVPVVPGRPRGE